MQVICTVCGKKGDLDKMMAVKPSKFKTFFYAHDACAKRLGRASRMPKRRRHGGD